MRRFLAWRATGVLSMTQQKITFEWVLEEGRADFWHTLEGNTAGLLGLQSREQIIAKRLLCALSLLFVMIAAAAGAGITPGEQNRREAQKGIAFALELENEAWQQRDRGLYEALIDPNLDDDWVEEWHDHWRSGADEHSSYEAKLLFVREADGIMQATVVTKQPAFEWWQISPYREERFYRRLDQRWIRTVPPASYWGEARQLETDLLHFYYYERDEEAVEAAASKLDAAYSGIYKTLGYGTPPLQKQRIAIVPSPSRRWSSVDQLEITSPLLAQIPSGQRDEEYLASEIMGWFTYRAIRDATPNTTTRYLYRWPLLVLGLRSWLRDDLLNQPAPWHVQAQEILREAALEYLPLQLSYVKDIGGNNRPTREEVILRHVAAESFIRFVAESYGRERLPDLLTALVRYGTWEEIIPPLYGHSTEKFVEDWNAHLLTQYGLEDFMHE